LNDPPLLPPDSYPSVRPDAYCSAEQRATVEAARYAGVNLAFWSGNECYGKVRWESSIDGSGQAYCIVGGGRGNWGRRK
ncbi:N,N-dimethylformamidase beta subunit family domain-containing protein, partial [Rhizobium ruizarguesonis]